MKYHLDTIRLSIGVESVPLFFPWKIFLPPNLVEYYIFRLTLLHRDVEVVKINICQCAQLILIRTSLLLVEYNIWGFSFQIWV